QTSIVFRCDRYGVRRSGAGLSTCVETWPRPISMRSHNKTASKHRIRKRRSWVDVLAARPAMTMLKGLALWGYARAVRGEAEQRVEEFALLLEEAALLLTETTWAVGAFHLLQEECHKERGGVGTLPGARQLT